MGRWAAIHHRPYRLPWSSLSPSYHRIVTPSSEETSKNTGPRKEGGRGLSALFDSAALPAVFERLLLLATTTTAAEAGDCSGSDGRSRKEAFELEEVKAGLEELLRWALPNLVCLVVGEGWSEG